jgi:hypothetical protein
MSGHTTCRTACNRAGKTNIRPCCNNSMHETLKTRTSLMKSRAISS